MSKITRSFIQLVFANAGSLRAQDIPYDGSLSVKAKIDSIVTPLVATVSHQVASGAQGGAFTAGAWRTRTLNTEVDPSGIVTLASNQITVAAGTYRIIARATAYAVGIHRIRIRDITNSVTLAEGVNTEANAIGYQNDTSASVLKTFSGSTVIELQHYGTTTNATSGFGYQLTAGSNEFYAVVEIHKLG